MDTEIDKSKIILTNFSKLIMKMFGDGQMDLHGTTPTGSRDNQTMEIRQKIM